MLANIWQTVFYEPLYNALVFLIDLIPGGSIALAVILLTIVVKFILFPLAQKSILSQARLKALEPEIERLKKEYPSKEEQAKKTFELYKKYKINPFSSCLLLIIQLPIILALYQVFIRGLKSETLGTHLYTFIQAPTALNFHFLGISNISEKSIVLAVLAGISQFFQMKFSVPAPTITAGDTSMKSQIAKSMHFNMRYILPVFIVFIAYQVSGAVALYWVTSNLFMIGQELAVRRKKKMLLEGLVEKK